MASSTIPANPTAHHVGQLIPKLYDQDADLRYMALNDLQQVLNVGHPTFLLHDFNHCTRLVEGLLHTLNDTNGEVQNMAIKCLGPFVNKAPEGILSPMIEKISTLQTSNAVDNSIPALALREIVISLPRPIAGIPRSRAVQDAYTAMSKSLMPRLVGYGATPASRKDQPLSKGMLATDMEKGTDSNAIDVLIEVARCFGPMLQDVEIQSLQNITFEILQNDRASSVLKKKAVVAMSTLATYFSDGLLSSFISQIIENFTVAHLTHSKRKLYITILGSMARSIPRKFGPYLKTLAPFVLSALSAQELEEEMEAMAEDEGRNPEADEVREAALVAIEAFLSSCTEDMRAYTDECISAATRFLKYDPNLAQVEDDDDDMDALEEDDDFGDEEFEEEGGFDDEDDASWKVRRCAAKVLYTIISTRSNGDLLDDGTLYDRVAPSLVARFKEREENVRLEVLSTLSLLVRNTGEGAIPDLSLVEDTSSPVTMAAPPSRKRRRGGSDASMFDSTNVSLSLGYTSPVTTTPPAGPRSSLAKLSPDIVRGVSQLLKTGPLSTKQASIILLREIVLAQRGGLSDYLNQLMDSIIDSIKATGSYGSSSSGASSATTLNTVRIHGLELLGAIADTHSSKVIQPFLATAVPALIVATREKYSKVSVEALIAVEQFIKALSPPRSAELGSQNQAHLEDLYDALTNRISANDADLEVRQRAIHVLGLLLGRTSGSQGLISQSKRTAGLDLLAERLKNELTRLASVRSIDTIMSLTRTKGELKPEWVRVVILELGAQLRKASRSLRGASLVTLRTMALNPASRELIDKPTIQETVNLLLPLLTTNDLHLFGPALIILATFVKDNADTVVTGDLIKRLCDVVKVSLSGSALEALLSLVRAIGAQGVGKGLMEALLQVVGVNGSPELVGKVIGTLLVFGSASVGVKLDDFVKELKSASDEKRQWLALAILGEASLLMGSGSPIQPDLFMAYFSAKSDKVPLAAAVALGRAGAGNIKVYLPVILETMSKPSSPQYLLLHSVREILQHQQAGPEIVPYAEQLWQNLVSASQAEDNKAIGAECIGRLAIIDPQTYLPQLQTFLSDRSPNTRGMVISALRYTFADTDDTYDEYLKPIVVGMLTKMLNESDLENRRLALTTFNSAMHNKPELILPHLNQLLPLAMKETIIKPELIREVQMGPFKHKVDDGLEIRKSAYETLYALLETAFSRVNISELYDRIVAGIGDEHDIRTLCNLMLSKLVVMAPDETHNRLETITERFRAVLSVKPKENAVKQEIERINEGAKGVVKVSLQLSKAFPVDTAGPEDAQLRSLKDFWEWVKKDLASLVKTVEDEAKEKDR